MDTVRSHSRQFVQLIDQHNIELVEVKWKEGRLDELPIEPCIVRASTRLDYSWIKLKEACDRLGHFLFYDDKLIGVDGTECDDPPLVPAAIDFFKRHNLIT